jgi:hypothetical protein
MRPYRPVTADQSASAPTTARPETLTPIISSPRRISLGRATAEWEAPERSEGDWFFDQAPTHEEA